MNARARWTLAALALVGALAVGYAARVLTELGPPRLSLEHTGLVRLDPRTRRALAELDGEVLATLCISARENLPSSERRVEREVTELLARMRAASNGRFDWQVLDPDAHPELADYLAAQGVAPIAMREVRQDRLAERNAHATLLLAYGAHGRACIRGLASEHLADLEALIVQDLNELARPSRPVIALAGAAGARRFAAWLGEHAELLEFDFDGGAELPARADFFVWLDPRAASESQVAALGRFLDSGRSALVAGSSFAAEPGAQLGQPALAIAAGASAIERVAAQFGVRYEHAVVLDAAGAEVQRAPDLPADPANVASIASDQDFRRLAAQPNGTLLFRAPTELSFDAALLAGRASSASVLAASAPGARARPAPFAAQPYAALAAGAQTAAEPLLVLVAPDDPWRGSLVLAAAATPFADGWFERPEFANQQLASALIASFAAPENLARNRARTHQVESLPPLSARARLGWRLFAILLAPALVLAAALVRGALAPGWKARGAGELGFALGLVALLAAGGFAARVLPAALRLDLSSEGLHALAPETRRIAGALGRGAIAAELCESRPLPPELAATGARARLLCAELEHAGAPLHLMRTLVDELPEESLAALAARGVRPRAVESRDETAVSTRPATLALVLERDGRRETLDLTRPGSEAALEFRLALALQRLQTGAPRPRVIFAADAPRLSPAEAREQYETRALFAPRETDAYSQAAALLESLDFDVVAVDPAAPGAPGDADLIVWMQPRRSIDPMLALLAAQLARGRNAFIAAQHFVVQPRQLQKDELALVWWPRPQFCDLERGWLAELGIALPREVLCDRLNAAIPIDTELQQGARRALERRTAAQPFVIRAIAADFDRDSPIVAGISDLVFPSGSRVVADPARLAAHGLAAHALVSSSPQTWAIDWKGGDLKPAELDPPAADYLGPQPLVVSCAGVFPTLDGAPGAAPARLVIAGSSRMFQDGRILDAEFPASGFLLDAAAALAVSDDAARILARRPERRGFEPPDARARLGWRAFAIGAGPLALLLFFAFARAADARGRRSP